MEGPGDHCLEPGAARALSPPHRVSQLWGVTGGLFGWKNVSLLYQEKLAGNSTSTGSSISSFPGMRWPPALLPAGDHPRPVFQGQGSRHMPR